ncbi:DUF1775 domain-containing protein [Streptomyces sp. NPDC051561]|uniref:DUF1775 domain-containing protein n=1 Tax=Streptomyces sp. NPDC051561 TaxID=3365658 RepID=UPI003791AEFE
MSSTWARTACRLTATAAATAAVTIIVVGPAFAHVEVEAEGARALAENVTLSFNAETESDRAGITKLEVILPKGVTPADVVYKQGPAGWKLTVTDQGYSVTGPTIAVGKDVAYSVTVRQLPDAKSLAFKTLQTYSDGRVDRWIELEKTTGSGHGSPAPRLELRPAAVGAKPLSPSPEAVPSTAAPSSPAAVPSPSDAKPPARESSAQQDDGVSPALLVVIGVIVVALGGGLWWFKCRGNTTT